MALTVVGVRFVTRGFTLFNSKMKKAGFSVIALGAASAKANVGLKALAIGMKAVTIAAAAVVAGIAIATAALGAFVVSSVKTSVEVEQSFAKIAKTVQGLAEPGEGLSELGEQVKQDFRDLAKTTPVLLTDLLDIGAIGGQLKVPVEQLARFADVIAQISVSTDLTAEKAATDFAKLASIFNVEGSEIVNWIEKTASATVFLGNTFATEESSILSFAERIAGPANTLGFMPSQILGIGAAFSQSGVEMQRGGTAVQKVLIKMQQAAAEGGDKLERFANTAGISGKNVAKFATLIKQTPQKPSVCLQRGLEQQGQKLSLFLQSLNYLTLDFWERSSTKPVLKVSLHELWSRELRRGKPITH